MGGLSRACRSTGVRHLSCHFHLWWWNSDQGAYQPCKGDNGPTEQVGRQIQVAIGLAPSHMPYSLPAWSYLESSIRL